MLSYARLYYGTEGLYIFGIVVPMMIPVPSIAEISDVTVVTVLPNRDRVISTIGPCVSVGTHRQPNANLTACMNTRLGNEQ